MVVVNVGPDQYDIYVECGEKRLEEWSLKSQGDQQECWVASEEGKEFRVVVNSRRPVVQEARFLLFLDGVLVHQIAIVAGRHYSFQLGHVRISKTEIQPFMFTNIRVHETDENWDEGILERLATIQAVFQRVRNRKTVSSRTYHTHALPAENPLDEKSKKAGHHGACLGDVVQRPEPVETRSSSERVPGAPTPVVIFHYAPLGYLQDQDHIPPGAPQSEELTPETMHNLPRTRVDKPDSRASSSLGRVKDEPTNTNIDIGARTNQDDEKPLRQPRDSRKRTFREDVILLSDSSDTVDRVDSGNRAHIKALRRPKPSGSKKVKLENGRIPARSEDVIVLSD